MHVLTTLRWAARGWLAALTAALTMAGTLTASAALADEPHGAAGAVFAGRPLPDDGSRRHGARRADRPALVARLVDGRPSPPAAVRRQCRKRHRLRVRSSGHQPAKHTVIGRFPKLVGHSG